MALALYVHVPFCLSKCPYCDFNTYAGIEPAMPSFVAALEREAALWGERLGRPRLASLFFGGGTPSYLPTPDIARLMRAARAAFDLPPDAEATIEANPGDCSRQRLQAMRRAGFNRISIGAQSFDDNELRLLGRRHTADQAAAAVAAAQAAGFDNVSVDLMFGLPNQYAASWAHTLDAAVELGTAHVSAYALTLEPGTPMEADVRLGRLSAPDPDLAADMYELAQETLAAAGLAQYEISNWAAPGRRSVHNLAYWRSDPYLGLGPGAHSHLPAGRYGRAASTRFANVRSPRAYAERIADGQDAVDAAAVEELDRATEMADAVMMGLRLNDGMPDADFRARFGEGIADAYPAAVAESVADGLLEWDADAAALRLTERGRLLANEALARFMRGA